MNNLLLAVIKSILNNEPYSKNYNENRNHTLIFILPIALYFNNLDRVLEEVEKCSRELSFPEIELDTIIRLATKIFIYKKDLIPLMDEKKYPSLSEEAKELIKEFRYNLLFQDALQKLNMNDPNFITFINSNDRKKVYNKDPKEFMWIWGVWPKLDEQNTIIDLKMTVPRIKDELSLNINIHEYYHALELFNELGTVYIEDTEKREERAVNKEKEYALIRTMCTP